MTRRAAVRYGRAVSDAIDTLLTALLREDDGGIRVHSLEEVRHAIPLIVLLSGLEVDALSEGVQELMLEAFEEAGLDASTDPAPSPDDTIAAFATYYGTYPVSPAILDEIRKVFEPEAGAPSKAAQALIGTEHGTGVLGGGTRPEGTIPAALGRLQTMAAPSKRKK
jgi:hypothetical protein